MIDILFAGNDQVLDGVLTCMLSIMKRSSNVEPLRVHVFTMTLTRLKPAYRAITQEQADFLQQVARRYNPENSVIRVDVTQLYERELGGCPNESAYCSPYTLLRLLADLVEGIPEKLLYLDADILFNRDIKLLYVTDISGYEYAAARDHYGKYLLNPNYINAGVLLLNMEKMRATGIFPRARQLLREKKLVFADQSALYRSTTRKKMLPQRFNDQKFLHDHTVVRHFSKRLFYLPYPHTENVKQWQVERVHQIFGYRQFDDILNEYLELKKNLDKGANSDD